VNGLALTGEVNAPAVGATASRVGVADRGPHPTIRRRQIRLVKRTEALFS
jgi:hypothetical protein